eukprot:jgi/Chlat1/6629/Chrsp482S06115
MAAPRGGRVLLGGAGARLTPEDVRAVAVRGVRVELDAAAVERLHRLQGPKQEEEASSALHSLAAVPPTVDHAAASNTPELLTEQVRAALLVLAAELLRCRPPPRATLPRFIIGALNAGLHAQLPHCASDAQALKHIATFICAGPQQDAPETLSAAGLAPPGLTPAERNWLQQSCCVSNALAALAVCACRALLGPADAIAALTCEALQSQTAAFEANLQDARPHKSQLDVASDLRSLLEGSKCVNARKGGITPASVRAVPQHHGPIRDACKAANAAVSIELNGGGEPPAAADKKGADTLPPPVPSPVVATAMADLQLALCRLASGSLRRTHAMLGALQGLQGIEESSRAMLQNMHLETEASVAAVRQDAGRLAGSLAAAEIAPESYEDVSTSLPTVAAALAAESAARVARAALVLEASAAMQVLSSREATQAARTTKPEATQEPAAASSKPNAAEEDENGGKKSARPPKKGGKGGALAGLQLGKGTSILYNFLKSRCVEEGTGGGKVDVNAIDKALAPDTDTLDKLLEDLRVAIESNESRRKPKIAKGTRDFLPEQMAIRERAFGTIVQVFKRHGAVALDTPVFELRETLTGKYGEDSKLIYDLADQGGELLSLRYDLTVPFARYLAMHNVGNIKRYHIARVYRRDNPAMNRGRFREFYQCDFDIAGSYPTMVPDSEVLRVLVEILEELRIGDFEVKLNHRALLDATLDLAGVPSNKFRTICSSIDKLDKEPWDEVRREMVEDKGLPADVADRVGELVQQRGEPNALLETLMSDKSAFASHAGAKQALDELKVLFQYLKALRVLHRFVFDLSLARGLDYYTGVIYEAVFKGESQVGSIAAGGRYDTLVGMFSGKQVPCVGVSFGIERVFSIMEDIERAKSSVIRATQTEVLVASIGSDLLTQRMEVAAELWAAGVKTEYLFTAAPNMQRQLTHALEAGIPWMVIFGGDELERGVVKVKNLADRTEQEVPRAELADTLSQLLASTPQTPVVVQ